MRKLRGASLVLPAAVFMAAGLASSAEAVALSCTCEEGPLVRLFVPGLYYEAIVERAAGPDAPFEYLGGRSYGCTEACEYLDTAVLEGITYRYRMTLFPQYGPIERLGPSEVTIPGLSSRALGSVASPNPFVENVAVHFRVPAIMAGEGGLPARMMILDPAGRVIRILEGGPLTRGAMTIEWDGRNQEGRRAPGGSYIYAIDARSHRETGHLIKLR